MYIRFIKLSNVNYVSVSFVVWDYFFQVKNNYLYHIIEQNDKLNSEIANLKNSAKSAIHAIHHTSD